MNGRAREKSLQALHIATWGLISCACPTIARAEPVTDEYAAGAQVVTTKDCALLTVQFHYRVQYAGHVPKTHGEELTVNLRAIDPLPVDTQNHFPRQAVPVEGGSLAGIRSLTVDLDQAIGPSLRVQFDHPVDFNVEGSGSFDSIVVATPRPGSNASCHVSDFASRAPGQGSASAGHTDISSTPKQSNVSKADFKLIEASMDEARFAIRKKNYKEAIRLLRRVLAYPENDHSSDALETLGEAQELAGQHDLAIASYEDYLHRYPNADGALRVAKRLGPAGEALRPAISPDSPQHNEPGKTNWYLTGSYSSFYTSDDSTTTAKDISLAPNPNADPDSHIVHQNAILNNVDLYGMINDDHAKTKFKFSGSFNQSMGTGISEQDTYGVSGAFVETTLKASNVTARLGRMTAGGTGVIGRYDGGLLSWQANPTYRLTIVGGAANWSSYDAPFLNDRFLGGVSVNIANPIPGSDISLFAIQQNDKWILDRRAIGSEFRWFKDNKSVYGLLDYDVHFQTLNAASLSGSYTFSDQSVLSGTYDYRRVPYLSTWSALQGQPFLTLFDMLKVNTLGQIEQYAIDRTPVFQSVMASYTHPLTPNLQIGGDATVTQMTGTPPSDGVDGTLPSGTEFYLSGQMTATNLFKEGDMYMGALRYAHLAGSNVYFMDINSRYPWNDALRISPRLRLGYQEGSSPQLTETTVLPSVLFDYQYAKNLAFESEVGVRWIDSNSAGIASVTKDFYITLGVRSDFSSEGVSHCAGLLAPCSQLWLGGARSNDELKSDKIYYPTAASGAGNAMLPSPAFAIEAASRYWFSQSHNRYDYFADATNAQRVSTLDYASSGSHAAELSFRGDIRQGLLRNVFLKGMIGVGTTPSGKLIDTDYPPLTSPYSSTVSDLNGRLAYWGLDLGYNLYTTDRLRLGGFVGFQQSWDNANASGCVQTANSPICTPAVPNSQLLVSEQDRWDSLRTGFVLDVNVTDRLKWKTEAALTGTSQHALDTHFATFGADPAKGKGGGFQLESSLDYRLNDRWDVGGGLRWWRTNTNALDSFGQLLQYRTDRYGAFAEMKYRFDLGNFGAK